MKGRCLIWCVFVDTGISIDFKYCVLVGTKEESDQ